ncbi:uncharacterized protein EKO05_0003536 [Ascochyta rabiei]|uniref:Uncharacterized protein n=1 Tax=Didymella rabiei TaxID=5454 RepID=A0A163GBX8_DIDRA|nr:uncharacterized protein EKO05_0003536 [Ascochyta rabiei]KZM24789.1 hypothetical protein ST47_g4014 [Ascochyta rabiei]UPX13007.1 hypothetical protein EKO05_0003536 [Ascochyta rabiei]
MKPTMFLTAAFAALVTAAALPVLEISSSPVAATSVSVESASTTSTLTSELYQRLNDTATSGATVSSVTASAVPQESSIGNHNLHDADVVVDALTASDPSQESTGWEYEEHSINTRLTDLIRLITSLGHIHQAILEVEPLNFSPTETDADSYIHKWMYRYIFQSDVDARKSEAQSLLRVVRRQSSREVLVWAKGLKSAAYQFVGREVKYIESQVYGKEKQYVRATVTSMWDEAFSSEDIDLLVTGAAADTSLAHSDGCGLFCEEDDVDDAMDEMDIAVECHCIQGFDECPVAGWVLEAAKKMCEKDPWGPGDGPDDVAQVE